MQQFKTDGPVMHGSIFAQQQIKAGGNVCPSIQTRSRMGTLD